MNIKLERIYTKPVDHNGYRVLTDRLWPRGISKFNAALDDWAKEIAPSTELRQWFQHEPAKFPEFKQRYLAELAANPAAPDFVTQLKRQGATQPIILLYGAKDDIHNQAQVLAEWLPKQL